MYDVLVIGCGITGAAMAYELSKYELKVAVLEKENDVAEGATKANSAILHAGYDPMPGSLMARLNVRGVELARQLCRELDVPYEPIGSLVLAFSEAQGESVEELYRRGVANGVPELRVLTGEEARAMEPNLSRAVVCALYAPTAAICMPWEYCLALAETAVVNGVELYLEHPVTALEPTGKGWKVTAGGEIFETRYVINAAGMEAGEVHALAAPCPFAIHPTRGEYYLMDKSEGGRVCHVIFQCPSEKGKGVLVAPTVDGNLIVGPNAQEVEGEDTRNTAQGMAYVRERAVESVPAIDFRQSIRNFAGVREVADTGDFIIGPVDGAPGFFDAAGICSPGLSAAPAVAEYLAHLLEDGGLKLERKPDFHGIRTRVKFNHLIAKEKAALVGENPAYGRVICRCEMVTEGEILDAIHSPIPPRSVDGVKRRAGAGLGRCQGGFCGPRVVELLCRELGLSPGEMLQDKAGSWMLAQETKGGGWHV